MSNSGIHVMEPYGELEYCKICMGFEGSMPTDCPSETMTTEQSNNVYAGNLDYRKEEGWVSKLSPMGQSIVMTKIFDMLQGKEGCHKSDASIILAIGTTKEEYNKIKKECLEYLYK
jgi:hypothetical protein